MTTQRPPIDAFPPGEFLRDELEERRWSQSDLAEIIGRSASVINGIIQGKRAITPETAKDLAAALGTSPEFWMNLESAYQLFKVKHDDADEIALRAKLYGKAPITEMVRRGWIVPSESVAVLNDQLCRFFGVKDIDDEPQVLRHAARKSTSYSGPPTERQTAWLCRAEQLARLVPSARYSEQSFDEAVSKLRLLRHAPPETRHVPRILSEAGIKFVIVQPLTGSKIDGACFWIDATPVVAISVRFDRIDNFWFCLMHELAHVHQGAELFDTDLLLAAREEDRPETERDADQFAREQLVPQKELESFMLRTRPLYTVRNIMAFAHTVGTHPGLVVGQLQFRGEVAYSNYRKTLVPVRDLITDSALTDGWGAELPAQL